MSVQQGAVILIDQSRGDIPQLTGREIHSLITTQEFARAKPEVLVSVARALLNAQRAVHADPKMGVEAVLKSGIPGLDPALVQTIVAICELAIPLTPEVSVEGVQMAFKLFLEDKTAPDFSKINLADYVAPEFAKRAVAGG